MLTVEDYGRIRIAHRDGMSIRQIARRYGHSRRKIRQVLQESEPRPYTLRKGRPAPRLGPYKALIDQILAADEQAPRKQRHTAAKLYRRLRDEGGYLGGYDQVRRYVGKHRRDRRETFIPLTHPPGRRLEADFGHIYVDFPDGRPQVSVLMLTWSHSGFRFAVALPSERTEAILAGMVEGFAFFGCVALEVWWDNPKTVATAILKGRQRQLHKRYEALASHYRFDPRFCMPARGNEKSYVEHSVYDLQRDWATPVPAVQDLAELNAYLRTCSLAKLDHRMAGKTQTVGELFEQDKQSAMALPPHPFDPFVPASAKVDKYQAVRFDTNRYSVPRRWAFTTVTVKAYVDRVEVVSTDSVIASHKRSYARGEWIVEPRHYLAILGRRPAALDHSSVFDCWALPACFEELREAFESRHGPMAGARQYVRVLQLLAEYPMKVVQEAMGHSRDTATANADQIIATTHRLSERRLGVPAEASPEAKTSSTVQVPIPTLGHFDRLLSSKQGDIDEDGQRTTFAAGTLETSASADHPGRIREARSGGGPGERPLPPIPAASG
ncbi:MAG: IS21 family transposase [Planctomycetota bacterium]|nr:IS21 family transposase [Planctomycetota bacterium]